MAATPSQLHVLLTYCMDFAQTMLKVLPLRLQDPRIRRTAGRGILLCAHAKFISDWITP
jgi:hypothetical protein